MAGRPGVGAQGRPSNPFIPSCAARREGRKLAAVSSGVDQEINQVMGEMTKLSQRAAQLRENIRSLRADRLALEEQERAAVRTQAEREEKLAGMRRSVEEAEQQVAALRLELGTALQSGLAPAEQQQLAEANGEIRRLEKENVSPAAGGSASSCLAARGGSAPAWGRSYV